LLAGDGVKFDPLGYATRAQCAALCTRTDKIVKTWYQEPGVPKEETPVTPPSDDNTSDGNSSGGGSSSGDTSGGNTGGASEDDNLGGGSKTTYYEVEFKLGGSEIDLDVTLPESKTYVSGTSITTLPTPFKKNTVFLGWYYDEELTQPVESGDTVTRNMTLYAKMSDSVADLDEGGTPNYVSSVDVDPESFYIKLSNNASKGSIKVINISNGNEDITSDVTVTSGEVRYSWKAGQTYQLEVTDGNVSIFFNGEEQDPAVRYYNFTTRKDPVLNLELNDNLIYIPSSDVGGMPKGAPSGLYSTTLENGKGML
ncbi:MAG: InlB B-repeat-containing protein, partial [Clostridiaceae bacterium]|nr:InlB B-repeat-containing protein [Clostridiaceae bacterium]